MNWWVKVAEELEALGAGRDARPNAVTPEALRAFDGPVIETSHRVVGPRQALPAPDATPLPKTHFPENGRLLDSRESFLSMGKKGRW